MGRTIKTWRKIEMTNKHEQHKELIDKIVSHLDLTGMTQDELFGQEDLIKTLTSRLLNRILETEMQILNPA